MPPFVQRLLLALLPTMVIVSIVLSTIWGDNGLVKRHELREEMVDETATLAAIERENQRLLRDLKVMDEDPLVLERLVAEELGWARKGATLYQFDDE